jgi:hypothetical protein
MIQRPTDAAPGGMGGATRMHDPSESAHDRTRRRAMNVAFVVIVALNFAQWRWIGVHGWDWLSVLLLMVAAMPLGMVVKVFELRFKMATEERQRALRELPLRKKAEFGAYALLAIAALTLNIERVSWALLGIWLYDFVTYYHDRPERIRHLYAVTKTLDELREFPVPWAWTLPAVAFEVVRRLLERQ